jgi:hypothetical protein
MVDAMEPEISISLFMYPSVRVGWSVMVIHSTIA